MARPTKLTPDVQVRIVNAISVGATYALAAQYGGVCPDTFTNWMRKGEAGKQPYVGFFEAVKEAEGAAAVKWLAKIEQAASDGTWQAAAWKLERRYPDDYGRQRHEHSGPGGGPIQTEDVTDVEARAVAILRAFEAARSDGDD